MKTTFNAETAEKHWDSLRARRARRFMWYLVPGSFEIVHPAPIFWADTKHEKGIPILLTSWLRAFVAAGYKPQMRWAFFHAHAFSVFKGRT
jgi:hypothetical protein